VEVKWARTNTLDALKEGSEFSAVCVAFSATVINVKAKKYEA
jgi:hypothetical protein